MSPHPIPEAEPASAHHCFVTQRWDKKSSHGAPVVGLSECEICGKKADEADWIAWKERNRWKDS